MGFVQGSATELWDLIQMGIDPPPPPNYCSTETTLHYQNRFTLSYSWSYENQ